jgi:hypothetical protein
VRDRFRIHLGTGTRPAAAVDVDYESIPLIGSPLASDGPIVYAERWTRERHAPCAVINAVDTRGGAFEKIASSTVTIDRAPASPAMRASSVG